MSDLAVPNGAPSGSVRDRDWWIRAAFWTGGATVLASAIGGALGNAAVAVRVGALAILGSVIVVINPDRTAEVVSDIASRIAKHETWRGIGRRFRKSNKSGDVWANKTARWVERVLGNSKSPLYHCHDAVAACKFGARKGISNLFEGQLAGLVLFCVVVGGLWNAVRADADGVRPHGMARLAKGLEGAVVAGSAAVVLDASSELVTRAWANWWGLKVEAMVDRLATVQDLLDKFPNRMDLVFAVKGETIAQVRQKMEESGIEQLPVFDHEGKGRQAIGMITDRDLTDALNPHDEDPYHDDDPIDDIAEKHDIDAKVSLSDGIHRIFAILKTAKLAVVVDDDGDIITLIGHQEAQKYAAMLDQDAAAAA